MNTVFTQDLPLDQLPADSIWKIVDLKDVVVTAQYAPTDSKNALQSIRTISQETIQRQGATNLEQLFQQDLNIRINQDLVLGSSMSLLGTGGENIKIMVDGVPVIGRLGGNIDLSQINLNNVERVEIIEGPMSVAYGTDALGGVINIITKKNQRYPFELTLRQQLETRGESISNVDAGLRITDNLLLRANVGRDNFDGFSTDTLRSILWNPKEQWYGDVSLRHDFGEDHRVIYQVSYFDETADDLGEVRRPIFQPYAFDASYLTRRLNHSLSHEGTVFKKFYWQTTYGYNDFDRESIDSRYEIDFDTSAVLERDTTRFDAWMARSVFASKFRNSKVNFQVGVDLRRERGAGDRIFDDSSGKPDESEIGDYAVFGTLRYEPTDRLILEGGMRRINNTRYDAPLIPSFNLKYKLTDDFTLRASYGKGFRSPSLKELFIEFIDINHYIIGNPNLRAETSQNYQLNFNYQRKRRHDLVEFRANLFYNDIDDQINLFTFAENDDGTFEPVSPDESFRYAYFNIENAKIRGANFNIIYQWQDFRIEGGISRLYQYNPISEDFDDIDKYTPTTELSTRIAYKIPVINTDISAFYRQNDRLLSFFPSVNEEGEDIAQQQLIDGFGQLDATLSRAFLNDRFQITAGVRNLTNVRQVGITGGSGGAHSGGSNRAIGVGRSFFVRASFRLFDTGSAKLINSELEDQEKEAMQVFGKNDELYASWMETNYDQEHHFQFAKNVDGKWTRPKTIAIGDEQWFVNDMDAPIMANFQGSDKSLMAIWLEKSNHRNVYDHHLRVSHSNNGGKNWKKAYQPYQSDIPAYFGLAKITHLNPNHNLLVWMDGRDTKEEKSTGRYYPVRGSKLKICSAEISKKGKIVNSQVLPIAPAQLCAYDLIKTKEGIIITYRNEQNQIHTLTYQKGAWQNPNIVSAEKWRSQNLLVDGPAIDVKENQAAIVWYSEKDKTPQIRLAIAEDGVNYQTPIQIARKTAIGKPNLLWLSEEEILISYIAEVKGKQCLSLAIIHKNGEVLQQQDIASSSLSQIHAPPQLNMLHQEIMLSYKWDGHLDYQIKRLKIDADHQILVEN